MAIASGILKTTSWKKQSGLGAPSTGASGKTARRTSSVFKADRDMFASNEIVSHHQSTGSAYGLQKADGNMAGEKMARSWAGNITPLLSRDMAPGGAVWS